MPKILDRPAYALFLFFITSIIILTALFLTVHNTPTVKVQEFQFKVVTLWAEEGLLRLGGMRFSEAPEDNPQTSVKTTIPQTFLFGSAILQDLVHTIRGSYSKRVMAIYNQLIVAVGAALLAATIFLALRNVSFPLFYAFAVALCAQVLYQTYPWNLAQVFRLFPSVFCLIFIFWFLFITTLNREVFDLDQRFWYQFAAIFLIVYADHTIAFFFLSGIFVLYIFEIINFQKGAILKLLLAPSALAFILFKLQITYVLVNFPEITVTGSHLLYRTGLDGSDAYYKNLWDLFDRTSYFPVYMTDFGSPADLSNWIVFFVIGILAFLITGIGCLFRKHYFQIIFFLTSILVLTYTFYAFILSQTVITHPFIYDVILFSGLIFSLYVGVPIILRDWLANENIIALIICIFSFAYAMAQLRAYAVAFPHNSIETWIPLGF